MRHSENQSRAVSGPKAKAKTLTSTTNYGMSLLYFKVNQNAIVASIDLAQCMGSSSTLVRAYSMGAMCFGDKTLRLHWVLVPSLLTALIAESASQWK